MTTAGRVSQTPVLSTDYFPTILELAGIDLPSNLILDGESFVPQLQNHTSAETRALFWHYPHYHGSQWTPGAAMRLGDWKLIEFYEFGDAELYNLATDPGELRNLAAAEHDRLDEMRQQLRQWQSELHATMPQPNPAWVAP